MSAGYVFKMKYAEKDVAGFGRQRYYQFVIIELLKKKRKGSRMSVGLKLGDKVRLRDGAKSIYEHDSSIILDLIDEYGWSWSDVYVVTEVSSNSVSGDTAIVSEDSRIRVPIYVDTNFLEPVLTDSVSIGTDTTDWIHLPKLKEAMGFLGMDWEEMDNAVKLANRLK